MSPSRKYWRNLLMKKFLRSCGVLFVISIIIAFIYNLIQVNIKYSFINALFTVGGIYLLVGGFLFINETGFLNYSRYCVRQISLWFSNKKTKESNREMLKQYMEHKVPHSSLTKPFIIVGIFIIIGTLILSYISY